MNLTGLYVFFGMLFVAFVLLVVPTYVWRELVRWVLYRATNEMRVRIISDNGRPYLERYYIGTFFGCVWYLHRFVGSDPDRRPHNHPWRRAYSFVLCGQYTEVRTTLIDLAFGRSPIYGRVRWFNRLDDLTFHRVLLTHELAHVWTLFVHSAPIVQNWGFLQENGDLDVYKYQNLDRKHWSTRERGRDLRKVGIACPFSRNPTLTDHMRMTDNVRDGIEAPWVESAL